MSGLSSSRTPVTNVGITLAILSLLSASTICALQFSSPAYTVNERDGSVNVCLEANVSESFDNDTQPTVNVNVFTIPESAESGVDFIGLNETVTFINSSQSSCFEVNISNDVIFEANETFTISADCIDSSGVSVTASSRITILDDEIAEISIANQSQTAQEGAGPVVVCALLNNPLDGLQDNVTVHFDTERSNEDSGGNQSHSVTFIEGSEINSIECFNILLPDNTVFENDWEITVTLSSDQSRVNILNGTVVITVENNLDLQLISNDSLTLIEGQNLNMLELILMANQQIERNFSIVVSTMNGTARENEDFIMSPRINEINFSPESVTSEMRLVVPISISIIDDDFGEPFEVFYVVVESADSARVTINGSGQVNINITIQDNEYVEGIIPNNFTATEVQSRSITFSWTLPNSTDSEIITGYTIDCNDTAESFDLDATTSKLVPNLLPFTFYTCCVYARVPGNRGEETNVTVRTAEERPGSSPINVATSEKTARNITFVWDPPVQTHGIIVNYTVKYSLSNETTPRTSEKPFTTREFTIKQLKPFQTVTVQISGSTSVGMGPFSTPFQDRTDESKPGQIQNLNGMPMDDTTLTLSWMEPEELNGIIQRYIIEVFNIMMDCSDTIGPDNLHNNINNSNSTSQRVDGLEPGKPFLIAVSAVNNAEKSNQKKICTFTAQRAPSAPMNVTVEVINTERDGKSSRSVRVRWQNLTLADARGWIEKYTVYYWDVSKDRSSAANQSTMGVNKSLMIESKLDMFKTYKFVVTATTGGGEGEDSTPYTLKGNPRPQQTGPVIAATVSVLVLIIVLILVAIIIVIVRFRRRVFRGRSATLSMKHLSPPSTIPLKGFRHFNHDSSGSHSSDNDVSTDIPVFDFPEYVKKLHRESNHLFEQQYRSIKDPNYKHQAAFLPCNCDTKNRFVDIYPYDTNRVMLKETAGIEGSDYINASWIDGYQKNKAYIAAQGPLEETVEDFWRMISDYELSTIVMVTRLIEGPKMIEKCKQYWPEKVGNMIRFKRSNMMVTLKERKTFADYCINTLTLKKPQCEEFEVTQFHYLGWPDHGVPEYATSLLGFLRHVRRRHYYTDPRPLLVHCSAGVGRTGTFITLDVMLQKIKEEKAVNVFKFVKQLRKHRCQMVQTESQYIFIHDALNEYITSGDTEIAVGNLRIAMSKLYSNNSAGFRRQFKLLTEVSRRPNQLDFDAANSELHQHKNRFPEKISYKDRGVKLRPSGILGGEYINATFINGYKCTNGFIAAQAPLQGTVEAFWRMIWENKCQTIVVLCDVETENTCVRFWPLSGGETYGKLRVNVSAKATEKNDILKRKFEVTFDKQRTSSNAFEKLSVSLFQHKEWNENGDQPSSRSILELNNSVIRSQISTGNKPILVTCSDGCGRTGTFLTIYSQIERLKTEQVIDVFQWVKSSRIQRAWLVNNQEQYELIYEVLSDFIDSFDTYANFQVAEDEL